MYRCGADTATTGRPCATHVPAPGRRCPRHRGQDYAKPTGNVIDLNAWRRYRNYHPEFRRAQAAR